MLGLWLWNSRIRNIRDAISGQIFGVRDVGRRQKLLLKLRNEKWNRIKQRRKGEILINSVCISRKRYTRQNFTPTGPSSSTVGQRQWSTSAGTVIYPQILKGSTILLVVPWQVQLSISTRSRSPIIYPEHRLPFQEESSLPDLRVVHLICFVADQLRYSVIWIESFLVTKICWTLHRVPLYQKPIDPQAGA